ncbi:hypothetical protein HWQ46_26745 [Shewanella sp. D64]|uniref:hypothetical protein n=1 Tax=unclassified Shewanella TaxID=196818 RepID=UPI0022BA4CBF|nr:MULTISPECIES: hypothetical protein [unclassified Shewanella]MEC4729106.1 hypothetical protein [Shewanella sp. D64]MEC4740902.1 hypothetical protein [Shewanella sp. E94]MEC4740922.1 hypothetical protein [Shewanella sp. E94]WBJ95301.1 hypothetical protein HWQ47_26530 [Shewanella sp. MTB7]WBJ96715.1 hypothetical protein HWQ47_06260 [Shewanella sp. MTB7]
MNKSKIRLGNMTQLQMRQWLALNDAIGFSHTFLKLSLSKRGLTEAVAVDLEDFGCARQHSSLVIHCVNHHKCTGCNGYMGDSV